ncbi:MAG: hypothetical protein HY397_01285 [Candidatus Doudnabacteria bacterium]|nr:hypothetical protein [Candidatus Doudnabacteria bacterium]
MPTINTSPDQWPGKSQSTFIFLALVLVFAALPGQAAEQSARHHLYRLYNPQLQDHFYTADLSEAQNSARSGYTLELTYGFLAARNPQEDQTAFYRLWHPKAKKHFYTDDNDDLAHAVLNLGYIYEGPVGFLTLTQDQEDGRVLYRLYNPASGDHVYTTSWVEWGMLQLSGYKDEGSLRGQFYTE